jgi:hypothetical protein
LRVRLKGEQAPIARHRKLERAVFNMPYREFYSGTAVFAPNHDNRLTISRPRRRPLRNEGDGVRRAHTEGCSRRAL